MNLTNDLGRIVVPLVTPFKENQEVDYDAAVAVATRVLETGKADSLIVCGTTGEFFSMTEAEREKLFVRILNEVGNRTKLVAGVGAASTIETMRLMKRAKEIGYHYVMVVAPYFTKPTQAELLEHFLTVSQASSIPVILYNIPIFTGVNLEPSTVSKLSVQPNIVAIKEEAELNPKQVTEYLNATDSDFVIYCGDDTMILESYAQGGPSRIGGVVSGASHLVGNTIRSMIEAFIRGEIREAAATQQKLFRLFRGLGSNGRINPVSLLKAAMNMIGYQAGLPRKPLLPATELEEKQLRELITDIGIGDDS